MFWPYFKTLPFAARRRVWSAQSIDGFASSMHQPHFALNLFSIVFFCAGCLMLLMSSHQRVRITPVSLTPHPLGDPTGHV